MKLPKSASTPARPPRSANSHRGPSMNSAFPNSLRAERGRALGGLVACSSPQVANMPQSRSHCKKQWREKKRSPFCLSKSPCRACCRAIRAQCMHAQAWGTAQSSSLLRGDLFVIHSAADADEHAHQ